MARVLSRDLNTKKEQLAVQLLGREFCQTEHVQPVGYDIATRTLSVKHAQSSEALERKIRLHTRTPVSIAYEDPQKISQQLAHIFPHPDPKLRSDGEKLLSYLERYALDNHASNLWLRPDEDGGCIAAEVDGEPRTITHPEYAPEGVVEPEVFNAVVTALTSEIPKQEMLKGQRALHSFTIDARHATFRISTMPNFNPEHKAQRTIAARLLRRYEFLPRIEDLGLEEEQIEQLQDAFLTTGTNIAIGGGMGEGKSTTLYVLIRRMLTRGVPVYSIEDPPEIWVPWITQVQLSDEWSSEQALTEMLRTSAKFVMVGEILENTVARLAIRHGATHSSIGKTLHTESALSIPSRLRDLGIPGPTSAGTLKTGVAQVLYTPLHSCKEPYLASSREKQFLRTVNVDIPDDDNLVLYRRRKDGCVDCAGTGTLPRRAVFEVATLNDVKSHECIRTEDYFGLFRHHRDIGFVSLTERLTLLVLEGAVEVAQLRKAANPLAGFPLMNNDFQARIDLARSKAHKPKSVARPDFTSYQKVATA